MTNRFEMTGQVEQEELVDLYAGARGIVFTPLREEYGFVTLEAFRSDKPVITVSDSGGPTELISNEKSGYIVSPEPFRIAEKLDILAANREEARRLGTNGNKSTSDITWENTIKELMK
jgi:glycosyltransferase involved in cell wall biosynthesis